MKILVAGASGLIGTALVPFLIQAGHKVYKLVREKKDLAPDEIHWDPEKESMREEDLEGMDAFINLAGENIAGGRWTEKRKNAILESRLKATRTLVKAIIRMKKPPQIFINASAVGYYGSRGDTLLTEASANGTGFLAHICEEWEAAAEPIASRGIRLVYTRFGVILSKKGGALAKMLIPFKLGLGGVIGTGRQYMSWIALDEVLGVIYHVLKTDSLSGPVNVVTPQPVTNYTFTKTLGKVLSRPTFLTMPVFIAKAAFGEMADEMLLASQRVSCDKLLKSGYQFCQPDLEKALRQIITS
jgi:uncharacterized protein